VPFVAHFRNRSLASLKDRETNRDEYR
jgi:hypothetical protein